MSLKNENWKPEKSNKVNKNYVTNIYLEEKKQKTLYSIFVYRIKLDNKTIQKHIHHLSVSKMGTFPFQFFYSWMFACFAIRFRFRKPHNRLMVHSHSQQQLRRMWMWIRTESKSQSPEKGGNVSYMEYTKTEENYITLKWSEEFFLFTQNPSLSWWDESQRRVVSRPKYFYVV